MDATFKFPLLWTVGFSGKRQLPGLEDRVRTAIDQALHFLCERAQKQISRLTAISSIARGGDLIFAECCQQTSVALPWKCLLPFAQDAFFQLDLEGLSSAELQQRRVAADACLSKVSQLDVLTSGGSALSDADRVTAYLECGYRTVDEADVMILVLREHEFHDVIRRVEQRHDEQKAGEKSPPNSSNPGLSLKAGTRSVALYAAAAKRPSILLNADAADPWLNRHVLNDPVSNDTEWFRDPNITDVMQRALAEPGGDSLEPDPCGDPSKRETLIHCTPRRQAVWTLMQRLGNYAMNRQKSTQSGLSRILTLHVFATAFAALGTTILGLTNEQFDHYTATSLALIIGIVVLAFTKPMLAGAAYFIERRQHKLHTRESWLYARILSELCRGAWAMWPLPRQPLDAADEEDFPKVKRLLRTLRLMRDLDKDAGVTNAPRESANNNLADHERETSAEANMRVACEHYIKHRLQDQADYYGRKRGTSLLQFQRWNRLFHGALLVTIVLGFVLALHKLLVASPWLHHVLEKLFHFNAVSHHTTQDPWRDIWQYIEFGVIIGPFLASYALGMITVLDCRRRARRYDEMQWFLNRIAGTLRDCSANPSRLRLIEHAERMMIEEQHEWFSTTRNFSV